jgi:hypothetical protein
MINNERHKKAISVLERHCISAGMDEDEVNGPLHNALVRTFSRIERLEERAAKAEELAAHASNIDYTAALESALKVFCDPDNSDYTLKVHIGQAAARLNSAIKALQNCA